ncbi:MAG: 2-C-methyl-D-erythritol 2,4-cyclodiphosphate synthase [Desulfobacteraceae bacterium]|nr:2-C-methyl-D-erythritol 2,4-cyclodiphosphate synthase [Desulfobacteraceae bacterium]
MNCPNFKIGSGFDVHRLVKGRDLILGGVNIPFEKGLAGHSDADVLIHSICDALLGAAGFGDIGEHFPDTDSQFEGISSLILLEKCANMLLEAGFSVCNIDSTIIAQAPKISSYKKEMIENIGTAMNIDNELVNIKATTTEKLGYTGKGEGIAAQTVTIITTIKDSK